MHLIPARGDKRTQAADIGIALRLVPPGRQGGSTPDLTSSFLTAAFAAPKVYGFDTGFVCHARGWTDLREDDLGPPCEQFALNELHARLQTRQVRYWREKKGHEADFVLAGRHRIPVAIGCTWSAAAFDAAGLRSFRRRYPEGESFVVAHDSMPASSRTIEQCGKLNDIYTMAGRTWQRV